MTDPSEFVLVDRVPTLGLDPAAPDVVTVRTFQASNPASSEDAPFHLTVLWRTPLPGRNGSVPDLMRRPTMSRVRSSRGRHTGGDGGARA